MSENTGWINWNQAAVLSDRYLEMTLSDWRNTGFQLLLAPIVGGLGAMVWGNVGKATESLYFYMTLTAIFLGCTDSCREIVKERSLFVRERMVNLDVGAYLFSKVRVLALVNIVQVVTFSLVLYKAVDVRVGIGWLIINLLVTCIMGSCLGLLISSAVRQSNIALGMIPLVILPQFIFSEFAIPKDQFEGASEWIYQLMPARWGFESLRHFSATEPDWIAGTGHLVPLIFFSLGFLILAYPILKRIRY